MKILFINTAYYPEIIGGTEISLQKLAEGLAKNNEVMVICKSDKEQEEIIHGVIVHRVKVEFDSKMQRIIKELYNAQLLNQIISIVDNFKPDIVNTNNIYPFTPAIWSVLYKKKIPIIHTIRDYYLLGSKFGIKNYYFRLCTKYVRAVTAASKYTLEEHIKNGYFYRSRCKRVIPNAIEIDEERFVRIRETRKNNNDNHIVFAFIGRLEQEKGIKFLIEAYENNENDSELRIFGKGYLQSYVEDISRKNNNIKYMGFLGQKELQSELENVDVVIVPTMSTFQEPFGRVVLDAYVNCIPVIVSSVGGLKDLVENGKTGRIYEADNFVSLRSQINYFSNREIIHSTYKSISETVQKYNIDNQIDDFIKLYSEYI